MTQDIIATGESLFDSIRHINEYGQEYWTGRELAPVLEYKQWRRFEDTINRAMIACEGSKIRASDHFAKVGKMVTLGSGSEIAVA